MFYLAGISGYDFLGSVIANSDKSLIHPYVIESGLYLRYMRDHFLSLSQSWARTESDPATFSLENALAHIPIAPWLSHSPPHLISSTSHLNYLSILILSILSILICFSVFRSSSSDPHWFDFFFFFALTQFIFPSSDIPNCHSDVNYIC